MPIHLLLKTSSYRLQLICRYYIDLFSLQFAPSAQPIDMIAIWSHLIMNLVVRLSIVPLFFQMFCFLNNVFCICYILSIHCWQLFCGIRPLLLIHVVDCNHWYYSSLSPTSLMCCSHCNNIINYTLRCVCLLPEQSSTKNNNRNKIRDNNIVI